MEVAVGFMGVGKTYTTSQLVDNYVKNGPNGWSARPVLAFDTNAEQAYSDYKAIDFNVEEQSEFKRAAQIRNIKAPGKYKILPYKKNRQPMSTSEMVTTAVTICKHYRNGLLILEDINKYTGYSYRQDLIGMFVGMRHLGVDVILHFQSLRAVPTRIWTNMTFLRWHKQADPIFKFKDRISNYELFSIAEEIVNQKYQEDQHYYLYVHNLKLKLMGVSQEDFKKGATAYLLRNRNELKRLEMDINADGKRKYSGTQDAINGFIAIKSREYLMPDTA
jgi:hypothetical protein